MPHQHLPIQAHCRIIVPAIAAVICALSWSPSAAQVLFDNTKAETAGNADWIIDTSQPIPSPPIAGITASSSESYWTGALSSWGVALAKLRNTSQIALPGNGLETLPSGGRITYGDASNAQDLSHYQIYVVCEPNILFTAAEKTAIVRFVQDGGGLFMVADHTGSDRNNDGHDSLQVWNDLFSNNSVQATPFGFTFNADSGTPTATVDSSPADPLIHGIGGSVTTLKYDVGCTMNITDTSVAHAAVWQTNPSKVMALYGTFGAGRFVAIGDSSVVEDATSSQGTTYAGWTTPADNGHCVINGMIWLLNTNSAAATPPSVTTSTATTIGTNAATLNASVNPNGQNAAARFRYGLTTNYSVTVPVPGVLTGATAQAVSLVVTGLASGTSYHFTVTATNLSGSSTGSDQTFITIATNSGTSAVTNYSGILAGWDVSGEAAYGTSPLAPVSNAPGVAVVGLTRGSGLTTSGTAASKAWGASGWSQSTATAGIGANQFITFALTGTNGGSLSLSAISRFDYRRPSSGPANGLLQYQVDSGSFSDITNVSYSSSASTGASLGSIDLSGIDSLQNVPAGTVVSFRVTNYGATSSSGAWYVFDVAGSTALDLSVSGSVSYPAPAITLTPIEIWRQQWFGTTNDSGVAADAYVAGGDGIPNLVKYALGLNPLLARTNPVTGDVASGFLRLTAPRNTNATDIGFFMESTGDLLAPWSTNAIRVDLNMPALLQGHDTNAVPATSQRFIRLRVSGP